VPVVIMLIVVIMPSMKMLVVPPPPSSAVVEESTHNLNIKGRIPPLALGCRKEQKLSVVTLSVIELNVVAPRA
jgi:hypothetical protein